MIEVSNINKTYNGRKIFSDFSLSIAKGERVVLLGPNGCGKTTLLNMIAGIAEPDMGTISVPQNRLSYIFQNYRESLFPWKTNYENVVFPLIIRGYGESEIRNRFNELAEVVQVSFDWNTYPYMLSGGQQQLVACMRALITYPEVLLVDEASSALDFENTLLLQSVLKRYCDALSPTVLMITHALDDAIGFGQRIVVLPKAPVLSGTVFTIEGRGSGLGDVQYQDRLKKDVLECFRKDTCAPLV